MPAQNTDPSKFEGRDGWLQNARHHTDEFHRNGPVGPVTWVLVSGHEIPQEAIEAGKEGDNTLYAARAYVEVRSPVTICLMKGQNLIQISFNPGRTLYDFQPHCQCLRFRLT